MASNRLSLALEIIDGLMSDLVRLTEVLDGTEYVEEEIVEVLPECECLHYVDMSQPLVKP